RQRSLPLAPRGPNCLDDDCFSHGSLLAELALRRPGNAGEGDAEPFDRSALTFPCGLGHAESLHVPKWILANDRLRAFGADRDRDRLHAHQLLDALNVALRIRRKLAVLAQIAERF